MAKYANKRKLKVLNGKKCLSSLDQFLILEGYSYQEAEKGLEPFISLWEESITFIERSKSSDIGAIEEYDHDIWARTELFNAMQHASEDVISKFEDRIKIADQRFKNATTNSLSPNNHIDSPDLYLHWWLFRRLKN
jgi:hypothetical protein